MGRAIVEVLARHGAHIVASDIARGTPDAMMEALGYRFGAEAGLSETVDAARSAGVRAIAVTADVADAEQVAALVETTMREFGRVDILVNVAGGSWGSNRIADYAPEDWLKTLHVNLYGPFLTTRAVLPHMEAQGRGSIVNIASIAAVRAHDMISAYGAAKAGLVQFTRDTAVEYGPSGIRANAVLPGDIDTELYAMEARGMAMLLGVTEAEVVAMSTATTPLRRLGTPGDIAELVAFLVSDRASFLTGLAIPATGGKELAFKPH
jgi:NAD(P)-dependent dehydrogenase (short-subunit alcohol dehydrogenase family)